jgi:IQ calmodulin-binding motif
VESGLVPSQDTAAPVLGGPAPASAPHDPRSEPPQTVPGNAVRESGATSPAIAPSWSSRENRVPVREMPPLQYGDTFAGSAAPTTTDSDNVIAQLDQMVTMEEEARKKGTMTLEDYEQVRRQMKQRQLERDNKLRKLVGIGQESLFEDSARLIQRVGRGYNGRKRARDAALHRARMRILSAGLTKLQAIVRGMIGRRQFEEKKRVYLQNHLRGSSATRIQSVFRGHKARKYTRKLRRYVSARNIQRCFRGHLGREAARRERARLDAIRAKQRAACKIQSAWRMKVAKEEFRSLRIHMVSWLLPTACERFRT